MESAIKILAHIFGLIGMAGVWLVPARVWSLAVRRRVGAPLQRSAAGLVVLTIVSVALVLSMVVAADALPRVLRCLWESRCTATRGGALFELGLFGLSVVVVEVAWLAGQLHLARKQRERA